MLIIYIMLLTLDSSTIIGSDSSDFTVEFSNGINVNKGIHEIALIKCNLWYSYNNVAAEFNNNQFTYTNNVAQIRTVTFPDGNYTITQLNTYLASYMTSVGDTVSIVLAPNYSTLKVSITLSNGYSINFNNGSFRILLGWNVGIYNFNGSQDGANPANINRDINSLLINCDVITGSYKNSSMSSVLYSFVPSSPPGSNIEISPQKLIYLSILRPDFITRIRMYITDQLGRRINLNGQPVTYLLHLRKRQEIFSPTIKNI